MRLDIERLKEIHPMMPAETAAERAHLGALALQRHHESGVVTQVRFETASHKATLHWTRRPDTDADQVDPRRMIEDGAEAVALSLVHAARGWVVLRRLVQGEHADWLVRDTKTGRLVALEVSGTNDGDGRARMRQKLAQVTLSTAARARAACVISFREPRAALEMVPETTR